MKSGEWLHNMFSKDAINFYLQPDLLFDVIWMFLKFVSYCKLYCSLI